MSLQPSNTQPQCLVRLLNHHYTTIHNDSIYSEQFLFSFRSLTWYVGKIYLALITMHNAGLKVRFEKKTMAHIIIMIRECEWDIIGHNVCAYSPILSGYENKLDFSIWLSFRNALEKCFPWELQWKHFVRLSVPKTATELDAVWCWKQFPFNFFHLSSKHCDLTLLKRQVYWIVSETFFSLRWTSVVTVEWFEQNPNKKKNNTNYVNHFIWIYVFMEYEWFKKNWPFQSTVWWDFFGTIFSTSYVIAWTWQYVCSFFRIQFSPLQNALEW